MKSRFISRRLVGMMLSMAGVFALSALPAQAATQEEAVVKQLQKEISKCPFMTWEERKPMINRLKQIGFRETFSAGDAEESFLVMERETPILLLGQPTQKLIVSSIADGAWAEETISAVFSKSSFNALKKYRRGNAEKDDLFITVRQAEEGVYLSCIGHISFDGG